MVSILCGHGREEKGFWGDEKQKDYRSNWLAKRSLAFWYACIKVCSLNGISTISRRGFDTRLTIAFASVSRMILIKRRLLISLPFSPNVREHLPSIYSFIQAQYYEIQIIHNWSLFDLISEHGIFNKYALFSCSAYSLLVYLNNVDTAS